MPSKGKQQQQAERKVYTRIPQILDHIPYYSFQGQARLAADAGYSRPTINRLIHGRSQPTFRLIAAVQRAFEKRLKRPIPVREWLSLDNTWPTPTICKVVGCRNCIPAHAYASDELLKPQFDGIPSGTWTNEDLEQVVK